MASFFNTGYGKAIDPLGFFGDGLFGGGGSNGGGGINIDELLSKYSYMPQYTGQTEKGLYDLFEQLTGHGGGGTAALPFDLGNPTTGLYDSLTRGIKEQYLGTPGGPQSGRINDLFAQANQMGIPEYGLNQARLANQDLNNSLLDTTAKLNENEKNRLLQILGLGTGVGTNLYSQNLAQHRANAGLALQGSLADAGLAQQIQEANQSSINDLLGGVGALAGTYFGGPVGGVVGQQAGSQLGDLFGGSSNVSRSGGSSYYPGVPSMYGSGSSKATLFK